MPSPFAAPSSMRTSPLGLHPFFHEVEDMPEGFFEDYDPKPLEIKYQRLQHKHIEESLEDRRNYEYQWEHGSRLMNLLAQPIADERLSNVLIPIVKIVILSRLSSLTKGEMDVSYVPGHDDEDLVDLWKDARRFTNTKCNYTYEMQRAYLMMSLFGNAPLYDGYRAMYSTQRIPVAGGFKETVFRDPKESKIFTESIMPWQFCMHPGGRDVHDSPSYTYTRYMDYDDWVAEFARVPKTSGKQLYMHTRTVQPGRGWKWDEQVKKFVSMKLSHRMVCVNYTWFPKMDLLTIESNGSLNWVGPNPYKHKRAPFNMLRLHPQMNNTGQDFAKWWQGDAWLLSGLDTLYQNVLNMFVDNFYFSQSSVIGVPQGVNIDVDDEEFYGGTLIRGAEKMVVSQLGTVDGNSYNFFWKMLNDLIVWSTGVPFNQLVPEGQVTAFELSKRIEMSNERMAGVFSLNEAYGLKGSEEQKISNIFQFLPQEDFYSISDPEAVDRMISEGKIAQNDVVYEDGIPTMVRTYPMIETKGRVIKEKFVNNFPVPEQAEIVETGRSGRLAARPENIHPMDWLRNNGIPDVYVDSSHLFGRDDAQERQETMEAAQMAFQQNDRARLNKKPEPFNEEEVYEDLIQTLKKNPRKWLRKNTDSGTRLGQDVDTKETERQMRAVIAERDDVPIESDQEPVVSPSPPATPGQGPQTEQGQIASQSQQIAGAATGQ